jgi:Flp pilus assembly protein CpaB
VRVARRLLRRPGAGWLLLAGLLAVLAAVLTARAASSVPPGEPVLVARTAIPAGTLLDAPAASELLTTSPAPSGPVLAGLLRRRGDVLGRRTAVPVAAGEPLTQAALGGAPGLGPGPLRPGERAVPVPLAAAGGAAAALVPGSRVDVVASTGEGAGGRSAVVVADAEVIAVGAGTQADVSGADSGSALLRVSARDALRLASALNFARDVRLLVRPVGEGRAP